LLCCSGKIRTITNVTSTCPPRCCLGHSWQALRQQSKSHSKRRQRGGTIVGFDPEAELSLRPQERAATQLGHFTVTGEVAGTRHRLCGGHLTLVAAMATNLS
jgi:hypothetical protein